LGGTADSKDLLFSTAIFFIEESLSFDRVVPALIFTTLSLAASTTPEFTSATPAPYLAGIPLISPAPSRSDLRNH
jgi:hypothetical protein